MATTMHWLPKRAAPSVISLRVPDRGGVDRDLVGAGLSSTADMSATVRMPPPTVNGMNTSAAVRATSSTIVPRSSGWR